MKPQIVEPEGQEDSMQLTWEKSTKLLGEQSKVGDELALAAARVCTEYDGIHRLRAALAKWYNLRAGIHNPTNQNKKEPK